MYKSVWSDTKMTIDEYVFSSLGRVVLNILISSLYKKTRWGGLVGIRNKENVAEKVTSKNI